MTYKIDIPEETNPKILEAEKRMLDHPESKDFALNFVLTLYYQGRYYSALTTLDKIDEQSFSSENFQVRVQLQHYIKALFTDKKLAHYNPEIAEEVSASIEDGLFIDAKAAFSLYRTFSKCDEQYYQFAYYFLQRSAKLGLAIAQGHLGHYYYRGCSLGQDDVKGFYWTQKAALQGEPTAMSNLGTHYLLGRGTRKNEERAYFYMMESIKKGILDSCGNVGVLLYEGRGVKQDREQAKALWLKGAQADMEDCKSYLALHFPIN